MGDKRVQVLPEVSDRRVQHVLDESCWCGPIVVDVTTFADLPDRVEDVVHRPEDGA
jgi:hypothetical protein